jgi:hypothetical protein
MIYDKKCKCIRNYYFDGDQLYQASDKKLNYRIVNTTIFVEYGKDRMCQFSINKNSEMDYFFHFFADIKEERRLKLNKILNK